MRLSLILILFVSTRAWALPSALPETHEGMFLSNALQRVVTFIKSPAGQTLFGDDFSAEAFAAKADQVDFELTSEDLIDKQGEKRCLMNYDGSSVIRVRDNDECLDHLRADPAALHVTLTHEVLNMLEIEKPRSVVGSLYEVSRKFLAVDGARIESGQEFVLHPTCEVGYSDLITAPMMRDSDRDLFRIKGYSYLGRVQWDPKRDSGVMELYVNLDGRGARAKRGDLTFTLQTWTSLRLFRGRYEVQVSVLRGGEQYMPIPKNRHARKTIREVLPTLPTCVKLPVAKR